MNTPQALLIISIMHLLPRWCGTHTSEVISNELIIKVDTNTSFNNGQ